MGVRILNDGFEMGVSNDAMKTKVGGVSTDWATSVNTKEVKNDRVRKENEVLITVAVQSRDERSDARLFPRCRCKRGDVLYRI